MRVSLTFRLLGAMALLSATVAGSPPQPPSEYQVKAAFLSNFVKFIEWSAATSHETGPI